MKEIKFFDKLIEKRRKERECCMVRIDETKCIGCGLCAKDCVGANIIIKDQKAVVKRECFECGHCVAICPKAAVEMEGYHMEEVVEYDPASFEVSTDVLLNTLRFRRSIRDYKAKTVEREILEKMSEAVRYSATAKNNQDTCVVFVQNELELFREMVWFYIEGLIPAKKPEIPRQLMPYVGFYRKRKANTKDDFLFRNAPVVVFITSDWVLDPGMAAQNMELVAVSQGLGVLYNGFLARIVNESEELKTWLGIQGKDIKGCMLLGYPNVRYKRTVPRKPANVVWK